MLECTDRTIIICAQKLYPKVPHYSVQESPLGIMSARALLKMGARALLNNECSSPQKDGCSCPLRIMGARPHFSREHFMNLFLSCSFCICSLVLYLIVLWMMSACALLNNGCSSPQKDGCSRPLKIMGARPHFSREHFMNLFFYESFVEVTENPPRV